MIRTRRSTTAILALVGGLACGHLVDPPLPDGTIEFQPSAVYTRWWGMVEACSGISLPLENVRWFAAPGILENPDGRGDRVDGYYSLAGNRIVLAADDTINGSTVRHEMLHALLRVTGHPRSSFLGKCGGVVGCGPGCVSDAGLPPQPDAATPRVAPSALEVTSELSPAEPRAGVDGGLFTLTVTARNPADHAVIVVLPDRNGGSWGTSYPFDIGGSQSRILGGDLAVDIGVTYFAAHETKRDFMDFAVSPYKGHPLDHLPGQGGNGVALSPGTYTFRGAYGDHWAPNIVAVLNQ